MTRHVVKATDADLNAAWSLYVDVCEHQALDAYTPLWTLGVYPSREDIAGHIGNGDLFMLLDDGVPVGTMVLVPHEDPEYVTVPWPSGVTDDDACAIHLLAVHPSQRGHGIGHELVREAIRLARSWGKKAIHLDVVQSNLAAINLYRSEGFSFVCPWQIHYEDTGTIDFDLFELTL